MNRNHHRIVFNPSRGALMAVSEFARSMGKASACTVTTAAVSMLFCLPLQAQISADAAAPGTQRPTVLNAANGVPLVNITTPSAAGVSRNTYRRFDVGSQGAILNNSRTDVQTRLGGWVQGNPWLAAGPARVILNEVHSSQPSQLNGFLEVGGQRAEVIIANPAGINVNGGGFINASRATLTTGTPVMNAGALEGFRVQGGQVRVEGLGLDASTTDHAAILARAVEVNAGLWANALTLVTGANDVSADASRITATVPTGAAPAFALDVAALGGMYAGQIRLVGTEAGLGVNQAGLIDARGALTLDVNGWLSQSAGARTYGDAVNINAQGVRNQDSAVIAARDALSIAAGEIHNTEGALLLSAGDMTLSASERIENRSAGIEALGHLSISTPVLVNANDHISHTVVSDATTNHTVYFTPGSAVDATDVAWRVVKPLDGFAQDEYDAYRREWLLPKSSAWADPAFKTYYLGPLPYVAAHVIWWDFGDSGYSEAVGDTFTYSRHSPVWAHFGMAAPTWDAPGQMPRAISDADTGWVQQPDPQAVAAWQAQAAPWVELTTRVASFKTAVEGQFLRFDAHSSYAQTTQRAVMTSSEPARISSGGSMTLNAGQSLLNQDSEIIAGGALSITGAQVTNQATEVSAPTSRSGTLSSWGVTGRDCGLFGCDPEYGWIHTPYTETVANTVPLPALRLEGASNATPSPALTSALSALSILNPDPTSGPLFETDPRFIDERQWLSSDHLLRALAVDPVTVHKQLGDGFMEQRLVREQVGQLTGRRFLGDFSNDEAQFLALMEAGITFAQTHQLRPGITLSAQQVTALTSDIVWLETQTITLPDGSTTQALAPRVYLLPRAGDLSASGALIAGRDVQMNLGGDVLNSGHIAGRELVQISAQNLVNTGLIDAASTAISAREDVSNMGGTISATDALIVQAGRDLNVQTTTAQGSGAAGVGRYRSEQVNRVAGLYVSNEAGVLLASAGRDVNLTAAVLQAGSVDVRAGRDLNLVTVNTGSLTDLYWDAHNRLRMERREETGTRITAGGDVVLRAGQDITARAANVQAEGALSAVAQRNVIIEAGEANFELDAARRTESSGPISSKTITTNITRRSTQAQVSQLQGQSVELLGTNVVSVGTHIQGQDSVHIEGTDQTLLYATQDSSFTQVDVTTKRSSVVGPKYRKTQSTDIEFSSVGIGTELISDEAVRIGVGERTELIGARVNAPSIEFVRSEHAAPDAVGELLLGAVVEKDVHSHQSKTVTDGVWQKIISSGQETETLKSTELHGQVQFDPTLRISAQIPAGPLRQQIEQLVQQPGLEYLQALAQREDIDWQAIDLAQRQWHDKQQGLTGAGAAILTLVVAYFTAGMGTELAIAASGSATGATATALTTTTAAGVTAYTAAGAALNAGFTSLASTAAVSFVNNGGDLGAVFKDLGSSASVNQLIAGMLTAGVVNSLASQLTVDAKALGSITAKDGFTSYFSKSLIEQSTSAVANSAINGTPLDEALKAALINSALGSATALGANAIGDLGLLEDLNGQPVLNPAGRALLHALLGCAGGAAQAGSQGCAAGASGAVLGELAAAWYDPTGTKPRSDTEAFAAAVAGLGGVLAGDESGAGVNTAAQAGRNAGANNFLNHAEASRRQKLRTDLQACVDETCRSNLQGEIDRLNRLDSWRDEQIEQACKSPASDACRGWSAALNSAAKSYHGQYGNVVDLAERSSVQQQAFLYQQATNNPFMHGVGKGLLKLTPPGLLVGAVGGVAMTVQAIVEKGLSETLIESANAITNLPADLNARLNSPDPSVKGEALVDLISLGSGVTAATAGGVKVSVDAAKRAQVAKAVAEAEIKARNQARIDNNFWADGASSSPVGLQTSAGVIPPNPHRTTTVLGRFASDMNSVINEQMQAHKSLDFGARPGGLNALNVDDFAASLPPEKFFAAINKPFLDEALHRGDDIALATIPQMRAHIIDPDTGDLIGIFAQELKYLVDRDHKPVNISHTKWVELKGWLK